MRTLRQEIKPVAYRMSALYWRLRTRGRVEGHAFRIRRPMRVAIARSGRLRIGDGTQIDKGASLVVRASCSIGSGGYLGRDLVLVAFDDIAIGDRVLLGERVSIHTENHGPSAHRHEYSTGPIEVGHDVWIGAGAVLTAGVSVGAGATVGANAVVTRDIDPGCLAVGVPATTKETRDRG